ncbi:MAG: thiamine diphosphokinase [Bacilli bacterium]|nr:thiamine diphosphokinase [Bacilli bacterium]
MAKQDFVVLVLGQDASPRLTKSLCVGAYVVGVDAGAFYCLENGIAMDEAIGDFDSVSPSGFTQLQESGTQITKLPVMKDDTDTEYAIKQFKTAKSILIVGGLQGKRIEHLYANLLLLSAYPSLSFVDNHSFVTIVEAGQKRVFPKKDYRFFSLFPLEDCLVQGQGLLYEYPTSVLKAGTRLGISNEFVAEEAVIELASGKALIICSEDDPKF